MYFTVAVSKNREGPSFGETTKDVCANLTVDTPEIQKCMDLMDKIMS